MEGEIDELKAFAGQTLDAFDVLAGAAARELAQTGRVSDGSALASGNTMTDARPQQTLRDLDEGRRRDLEVISEQPAIAWIDIVDGHGAPRTLYIVSATPRVAAPAGALYASYRAPMGRLAALSVGEDASVRTPSGDVFYEVSARAELRPRNSEAGWDARDTVVFGYTSAPQTIVSLRDLIEGGALEDGDILDRLLEEGRVGRQIMEGIRRTVLEKMGLRERPLLDRYQDDIFRLPLSAKIAVLGPPGSGKTTTLIKRLGLKLDPDHLLDDDRRSIELSAAGFGGHARSWIMFTPSQLLKQYVKEAFAREQIPAPDDNIRTWEDFRREIARNSLSILRTSNSSGGVLKPNLANLRSETIHAQTAWYEEMFAGQDRAFWADLESSAELLAQAADEDVARIGRRLSALLQREASSGAGGVAVLDGASAETGVLLQRMRDALDQRLRKALSADLRKGSIAPDALIAMISGLDVEATHEGDDTDDDEEEEATAPVRDLQDAFAAYSRAVTALARSRVLGRRLGKASRNGRIIEWLAERTPRDEELTEIGATAVQLSALRRFGNPVRQYLAGLPRRYRRWRREREDEGRWYAAERTAPGELGPLEVDAVLLAMLRAGGVMLRDTRLAQKIESQQYGLLRTIGDLRRSQVLVDEATDFGPLQLAAMAQLCDPAVGAFVACGDFNQRITRWGARSEVELNWAVPQLDIRKIAITYRHTRQLNELAHALAAAGGSDAAPALLPAHVDSEGVAPLLASGLSVDQTTIWLAARLREIEARHRLPSVAVLVNRESEVQPLADALNAALQGANIQCVGCPNGMARGQDNDVRVFDVRHIKGLEFEAVFFVNVDELAASEPDLFDKFLFVGATRAATYLGLTSKGTELPKAIEGVRNLFVQDWRL